MSANRIFPGIINTNTSEFTLILWCAQSTPPPVIIDIFFVTLPFIHHQKWGMITKFKCTCNFLPLSWSRSIKKVMMLSLRTSEECVRAWRGGCFPPREWESPPVAIETEPMATPSQRASPCSPVMICYSYVSEKCVLLPHASATTDHFLSWLFV